MAKVKLTRSQMAFAAGETLEDFDKRTEGKDPTEDISLPETSPFFSDKEKEPEASSDSSGGDDGDDGDGDDREYIDDTIDDETGDDETGDQDGDDDPIDDGDEPSKPVGKAAKKTAKAPKWADKSAREYAAAYGLSDSDLANFDTINELHEYGRKTDKALLEGSKKPAGKDDKKPDKKSGDGGSGDTVSPLDRLKPLDRQKYVDAKYGEEELNLVDGLNATIEALREVFPAVQEQKSRQQQDREQREALEFNSALDEIDPKAFGRAVRDGKIAEMSDGFARNRLKVHSVVEQLATAIADDQESRGQPVQLPPIKTLTQRAAAIVFGDGSIKPVQSNASGSGKSRPDKETVTKQSRRRRPTSSVGRRGASGADGKTVPSSPQENVRSIAAHPALQRFWKQTQRANGAE